MSLPAPDLDQRTFQEIVDDAKRLIGLRCPEWTDHNVSDPGVTLIELFAMISETMLFQMNQVPEKNHIRFLELLGVKLEMPRPAVADLRYVLTKAVEDREGAEFTGITLKRDTVASTLRNESEDPIEFLTDHDLVLGRPRLEHLIALPAKLADDEAGSPGEDGVRGFDLLAPEAYAQPAPGEDRPDRPFRIFSNRPAAGDRLLFGFAADVSGHVLDLDVFVGMNAAVGREDAHPLHVWEAWDAGGNVWRPLAPLSDATRGLAVPGVVRLELPQGLQPRVIAGANARWVRLRYVGPPIGPSGADGERARGLDESPAIRSVRAATVGGHVQATNCRRIYDEVLGEGDGTPGQCFTTRHRPIFALGPRDVVLTGPRHDDPADRTDWVEWVARPDFSVGMPHECPKCGAPLPKTPPPELPDGEFETCPACDAPLPRGGRPAFSESGPDDRHFVVDERTGEIRFGPRIDRADGRAPDLYGAAPTKGHLVVLTGYAFGGGTVGNVREGRIVVDKASQSYVASVANPLAAQNGRDMEKVEHAKMKATKLLKTRNRAVTAEDYEMLAGERHGVGRAVCLQPRAYEPLEGRSPRPGTVELLIVPALGGSRTPGIQNLVVSAETLRDVQTHLDEARLLTTVLKVREPRYVFVETEIQLVTHPRFKEDRVFFEVRERLDRFLHPLTGGIDPDDPSGDRPGRGWPFGRRLRLTDFYVQIGQVPGVSFLKEITMLAYRVGRPSTGGFGKSETIDIQHGQDLRLDPDETICSLRHNVRRVPLHEIPRDAENLLPDPGSDL